MSDLNNSEEKQTSSNSKTSSKDELRDASNFSHWRIFLTIILLVLLFGSTSLIAFLTNKVRSLKPINFDECAKLKTSVIQQGYPVVCTTKEGYRFTQQFNVNFADKTLEFELQQDNDTSSWETYTDINYGYSIQYPNNLHLSEAGSGSPSIQISNDWGERPGPQEYFSITLLTYQVNENTSLDEWLKENITNRLPLGQTLSGLVSQPPFHTQEGVETLSFTGISDIRENSEVKYAYLKSEGVIYEFYTYGYGVGNSYKDNPNAEKMFDKILSTFKLPEANVQGIQTVSCLESEQKMLEEINRCEEVTEEECLVIKKGFDECTTYCQKDNPDETVCFEICKPVCNALDTNEKK